MEQWKIQKIQNIKDEVRELHPLLRQIFSAISDIARFEYTHGQTEMGADFVLAKTDETLGVETYIGVIAKTGNIHQDISEIKRQIEECAVSRYFDGGKSKIHLHEVWVLTNGAITHGAERRIYEDYKNRSIRFIQQEKLCELTEKYAPHFWSEISTNLNKHLLSTLQTVNQNQGAAVINISGTEIDIKQELRRIPNNSPTKVFRVKKSAFFSLEKAATSNQIITIEGGMGSGKTSTIKKIY